MQPREQFQPQARTPRPVTGGFTRQSIDGVSATGVRPRQFVAAQPRPQYASQPAPAATQPAQVPQPPQPVAPLQGSPVQNWSPVPQPQVQQSVQPQAIASQPATYRPAVQQQTSWQQASVPQPVQQPPVQPYPQTQAVQQPPVTTAPASSVPTQVRGQFMPTQPATSPAFQATAQPQVSSQPAPSPQRQQHAPVQAPLEKQFNLPERQAAKQSKVRAWRKRLAIAGSFAVIVGLMVGGWSFWSWSQAQNTPQKIFADALSNSFRLTSLDVSIQKGTVSQQAVFDFSNQDQPVVSTTAEVQLAGEPFAMAGYGTPSDSFVSFTKTPADLSSATADLIRNRWVALRSDGKLDVTADRSLVAVADPSSVLVQPIVFGNFSAKDQREYVNYFKTNNVYSYKPEQVTKQQFNGTEALAYPVTLNISLLKLFNQSTALAEGFSTSDATRATNSLDALKDADATLYVDPGSRQFVGLVATKDGVTTTYMYTAHNHASIDTQPETHLAWRQFSPLAYRALAELAARESGTVRDAIRKQNLAALSDYLKTYAQQNGNYPSLQQMNDPAWLQLHMPDLNSELLRDPVGQSIALSNAPTVGAYAYQPLNYLSKGSCDNTISQCAHFKLVAVLSNKQQYVLKDQ